MCERGGVAEAKCHVPMFDDPSDVRFWPEADIQLAEFDDRL